VRCRCGEQRNAFDAPPEAALIFQCRFTVNRVGKHVRQIMIQQSAARLLSVARSTRAASSLRSSANFCLPPPVPEHNRNLTASFEQLRTINSNASFTDPTSDWQHWMNDSPRQNCFFPW